MGKLNHFCSKVVVVFFLSLCRHFRLSSQIAIINNEPKS